MALVICTDPTPECCYSGTCTSCPGIETLRNFLNNVLEEQNIDSITYKRWISTPRTNLETTIKNASEFVDDFCEKVKILLPHSFIAKQQGNFMKVTKESLQDGEFLVLCDFAENYAFVVLNAAPGFHWNNNQATIYPVVVYFEHNGEMNHKSLVVISDCLTHDSIAVYVYTRIIIDSIKSIDRAASKIYYFSDEAPQQFKNFKNFVNIFYHKEDYGISAEWHYFPTAHGKGACDGVGGTVKRLAARASLQLSPDRQIITPQGLFEWPSQSNNLPNINVKFSPENMYNEAKVFLEGRFINSKRIPGTQKLHSIIPQLNDILNVKRFSTSEKYVPYKILKHN